MLISGRGYNMPPPGCSIDRTDPLAQALCGAWLFNAKTGILVKDIAGGQDAVLTLSSGAGWDGGKYGPAFYFSNAGSGSRALSTTNYLLTNLQGVEFTLMAYLTQSNVTGWIVSTCDNTPHTGWGFMCQSSGVLLFRTFDGSTNHDLTSASSLALDLTTWYQVAVTVRAGIATIFINGRSDKVGSNIHGTIAAGVRAFTIGDRGDQGGEHIKAKFNTIYFWRRALSLKEINFLYGEPFCFVRSIPATNFYTPPPIVTSSRAYISG